MKSKENKEQKPKKEKKQKLPKGVNDNPSAAVLKAQSGLKKATGLLQSVGGALKETKISNPIKSVGTKLFLIIFCSIIA
ncbi:hypothetical protein AB4Z21_05085, partial [Paenibacillus sp. MCAF20]